MSSFGFILRRLALTSLEREAVNIEFERGLNVVWGPSDTGKTFVTQCINFMLGGSQPPKSIPEVEGYDTVLLDIESASGECMTLSRPILGGAFTLTQDDTTTTLKETHDPNNDNTLSHHLLSLTGLTGKRVRTNVGGRTRTLSFRDVVRHILVGEGDIIAERSPVLSGQYTEKTAETSVFRLLLTGADDSSLVEVDDRKVVLGRQQGRRELLEDLLKGNEQELSSKTNEEVSEDTISQLQQAAKVAVREATEILTTERESISALEQERKMAWTSLRRVESRTAVVKELQARFELLKEQYESDLRRLEAIGEAGVRLAQMGEERCPVCGAPAEHHQIEHRRTHAQPIEVATSCSAESQKIRHLLLDLMTTLERNQVELARLSSEEVELRELMSMSLERLNQELKPRLVELHASLREAEKRDAHVERLASLYRQRQELLALLEEAKRPIPKQAKLPSASINLEEAGAFVSAFEGLLRAWNVPNLTNVSFSVKDQDFVLGDQKRASHGKGIRAITHAAFSLALLRACLENDRPHPGLVILDSPLIVYKAPDPLENGEEFKVKETFYRAVASDFAQNQVIIIENEEPPIDLANAHVIAFTGHTHGRPGFLPRRSDAAQNNPSS